jgi:hypothetical protein
MDLRIYKFPLKNLREVHETCKKSMIIFLFIKSAEL